MDRRLVRIGLFFALSLVLFTVLGCYTAVVRVPPPPPRVETYGPAPYPDAVWVPGHWMYRGGEWVWIPGHWERRPRSGAVWVPGHWERRGEGWVWKDGHWEYR
jgi:hypothetical protein